MRNRLFFYIVIISLGLLQWSCDDNKPFSSILVNGVKSPEISLNGTWKFSMDAPDSIWNNSVDFHEWSDIQVPGECQMQGFAIKHDQPYYYKYEFDIPPDYEGKNIYIDFHGVYSYARVWVNGIFVREHFGGFTKWSCDITDHVSPSQKAILTVEIVDRIDDISYGSGYAKHQIGGILRDVVLKSLPKQHFKELYFTTDLDEAYENANLDVHYELAKSSPSSIEIDILDPLGELLESKEFNKVSGTGKLTFSLTDPLKWDAEHPHLYTVVTSLLEEGIEIYSISRRVGIREVEVDGNRLLVNGKPVKLRGACRHDMHPTLGRMTTPEYDKQDVLLAKEANMNFIRTSHYPPSDAFLDYCDEFGIYVEDETAVCFVGSHRTFDYQSTGASQNQESYTHRYLSQLEEMVDHHRNHPSVIIWSIGNENVFGSNFTKSYEWVKKEDPSRPVIYSYPGPVPDSVRNYEILSMHYPDWEGNLNQYGIATDGFAKDEMPVLFDEWAHVACYNNPTIRYDPNVRNFWGQSLDLMWSKLFEADGGLGGAIWCMVDETFMLPEDLEGYNQWWGKLDPKVIPATYMGPTVGYGEWGIIDTWRRKKPEFWATKKAYSPTKVLITEVHEFVPGKVLKLPVHNRFDHTNFSELKITYKYWNNSGILKDVDLAPHTKGHLTIPAQNWINGSKLQINFYDKNEHLIDEYLVQLGLPIINIPSIQNGELKVEDGERFIAVSGENYNFKVDKSTGLLNDVIIQNDTLIKSGPYINLSFPGKRIQYSTIVMADYATHWKSSNFTYTHSNGILQIHTEGAYDSISARYDIDIDANGIISIQYSYDRAPADKMIQESGIKFMLGDQFSELEWNRKSHFSSYPLEDLGSPTGNIEIHHRPGYKYREKPLNTWAMDNKNFFYHGLTKELPYSNIVRSMKEYIYSYKLSTARSSLGVYSDGKQACRFDKLDGQNILLVNDLWDYQSLLWGNYMKMIQSKGHADGQVTIKIE